MEDDLQWRHFSWEKTYIFCGRRPLIEGDLWYKTHFQQGDLQLGKVCFALNCICSYFCWQTWLNCTSAKLGAWPSSVPACSGILLAKNLHVINLLVDNSHFGSSVWVLDPPTSRPRLENLKNVSILVPHTQVTLWFKVWDALTKILFLLVRHE